MVLHLFNMAIHTFGSQLTHWWEGSHKIEDHAPTILTFSALILAIFWYMRAFIKSRKESISLPPGPYGLPIVGYLPFLGTNLHRIFAELAHRYGPIFKLNLGNKLYVVLSSPTLAKEVVRDQDTIFGNRDPPIAALVVTYGGLDIAWSSYGSYWRTMRKIFVREMLSNNSLESSRNLRREGVHKTIRDINTKIGKPLDIGEITFLTSLDVVMRMLWGSTLDSEKDSDIIGAEFRESITKITEALGMPNISDFFPMLGMFDMQGVERETKRVFRLVERILDTKIDERMKSSSVKIGEDNNDGKKDFLQILLKIKEIEDTGEVINKKQIKALLMDIVVGGTDTTATIAEFAMAEVINNSEVMKKVQEELSNIVGINNIVEESHLPKLQYLDAVIKESFRLHPPIPLLVPRCPSKSCTVGGYTIPKGTRVFLNVWAMHRDPKYWDNPYEFNPERFLNGNGKWDYSGNDFEYLPFGSGRRICAGVPMAEKMLMFVLASFLHSFKWNFPKGETMDFSEKFGIVVKKKKPLIAIPTPRLSNMDLYK